jgi:hypothetical protein
MTTVKKKWWADHMSTIMGISVAVSTAWLTIDWKTFDISKEYPKLILSAIIAIGGYVTTIKTK